MATPLPAVCEQKAIASLLNAAELTLEEAKMEGDGLELLKEATADALLTGRVRVGEREIENC